MQFLILRGHTRLIPQGGLAEFPDAILNAKRLDLYNLYREVTIHASFFVLMMCDHVTVTIVLILINLTAEKY